jgi:hypothetical protein
MQLFVNHVYTFYLFIGFCVCVCGGGVYGVGIDQNIYLHIW